MAYDNYFNTVASESYTYFDANIRPLPRRSDGSWDFSTGQFVNNDVDAFRHGYASAVSSYDYGTLITRAAGDWHEIMASSVEYQGRKGNVPQPLNQANMDLWNNDYGIDTYDRIKDSLDDSNYKSKLAEAVKQGLQNGELITDPNNPSNPEFDKNLITKYSEELFNQMQSIDPAELAGDLADFFKWLLGTPVIPTPVGDGISVAINAFLDALGIASPIVLDIDGDGLELISLANSKTYFDIDNDLFAERTGWVKGDDGFLVRDLNGNGKIDNQGEMFGDNGGTSAYAKLAALDSNNDKKITSTDAAFASLRIWQDKNQNGVMDAGELKTLSGAGITSLNTASTASTAVNQGHTVAATSTFIRTNGTTGNAADIFFQKNDVDSWYVGNGTPASRLIDMDALFLPLSRGYGKLPSWLDSFSQNDTLKNMALNLVDDAGAELNPQALQAKVEAFMFEWAGVSGLSSTSRGSSIDARKLVFLEKMVDQPYISPGSIPGGAQAVKLMEAWGNIFQEVQARLLVQGPLAYVMPAHYQYVDDKIVFHKTLTETLALVSANAPTSSADHFYYWQAVGSALKGQHGGFGVTEVALSQAITSAAGFIVISGAENYLVGTAGVDSISGTSVSDYLYGLEGNDTLLAGSGNDILHGGKGNDSVTGDNGNDVFLINQSDGLDTLFGGTGQDTLSFGTGITWANLQFSRVNASDILVTVPGGSSILIKDGAKSGDWPIEIFKFADGTTKTLADMQARMVTVGTSGNDSVTGFDAANDTIDGAAGNDTIQGLGGDDSLTGGKGNDSVSGDGGNDVFIINQSDGLDTVFGGTGQDTLSFGTGITWANLQFSRVNTSDILVTVPGGGSVLIKDGAKSGDWPIETFKFTDGTTKTLADMQARMVTVGTSGNDIINGFDTANDTISGGLGNDSISGLGGNDSLTGGKGNDVVNGDGGNDTIVINQADGVDTITGGTGQDTLSFTGTSITWSALNFSRSGANDILVAVPGGGSVLIKNGAYHGDWPVEFFKFTDGTTKTLADVQARMTISTTGNDSIMGFDAANDTINGGLGNDSISGFGGNDSLTGGKGNDIVYGDGGNDTFVIIQGDGIDTIAGGTGQDILSFGSGITWANLQFARSGALDVLVTVPGGGSILIKDGASHGDWPIEAFKFTDGTTKTLADMQTKIASLSTSGNDTITGFDSRNDSLSGAAGNDSIKAYSGNDTLMGGIGNDTLIGDDGNDLLVGGAGVDSMAGGAGLDVFDFNAISESRKASADLITDFSTTDDRIDLKGLGFTGIAAGAAVGTKLGFTYDSATNDTIIVGVTDFKIILDGNKALDATDFIFS